MLFKLQFISTGSQNVLKYFKFDPFSAIASSIVDISRFRFQSIRRIFCALHSIWLITSRVIMLTQGHTAKILPFELKSAVFSALYHNLRDVSKLDQIYINLSNSGLKINVLRSNVKNVLLWVILMNWPVLRTYPKNLALRTGLQIFFNGCNDQTNSIVGLNKKKQGN